MPWALRTLLSLMLACSSAPGNREVRMPLDAANPDVETGAIELVFSREASNIVVAINGRLVVDIESAKRVRISDVETGYADLSIAADGVERSARVWVDPARVTAVPVGNAGRQERMNPVSMAVLSIVAFLISRAATDYLF